MKSRKTADGDGAPVLVVFCGLPGVGKTTVIEQLKDEVDFPRQVLVDLPEQKEQNNAAIMRAIALNESIALETVMDDPAAIAWMHKAAERGFDVELVVVGTEDDELLEHRARIRKLKQKMLDAHLRHLAVALDAAHRVLLIDNSSGVPFIASRIEGGTVQVLDRRPSWVVSRIAGPRLARANSLHVIERAYDAIVENATVKPVLQLASASSATAYSGKVVAVSEYHVLQQTGEAMHIIHDLALLGGGPVLAVGALVSISYGAAKEAEAGVGAGAPKRQQKER